MDPNALLPSIFRVTISKAYARNLAPKNKDGTSDPYVLGDFDSYRSFKFPTKKKTLDPNWLDYSLSFNYQTKFQDNLHLKKLEFTVKDSAFLARNSTIGTCSVDLASLAMGPNRVKMEVLSETEVPSGDLYVVIEMEDVSHNVKVDLKDVKIKQFCSGKHSKADLCIGVNTMSGKSGSKKTAYTSTQDAFSRSGEVYEFDEVPHVSFENVSIRDLMNDMLLVKISHKKMFGHSTLAKGSIAFGREGIMTGKDNDPQEFRCRLLDEDGYQVAIMEGKLEFEGLPDYAPMKVGENRNGDIYGTPLLPELPKPRNYKGELPDPPSPPPIGPPPPSTNAPRPPSQPYNRGPPPPQYYRGPPPQQYNHSSPPQQFNRGPPPQQFQRGPPPRQFQRGPPPQQFNRGPPQQRPLPPGWEAKPDPKTGRIVYIDHRNQRTQWSHPLG